MTQGQQQQVLPATLDCEAAAWLFIGTLQGLVMQSLLANALPPPAAGPAPFTDEFAPVDRYLGSLHP